MKKMRLKKNIHELVNDNFELIDPKLRIGDLGEVISIAVKFENYNKPIVFNGKELENSLEVYKK